MNRPRLIEARPLDGGVELIFEIGARRAAVRAWPTRAPRPSIQFPHPATELGESLGTEQLDQRVREAGREALTRGEAAALWAEVRRAGGEAA